MASGRVGRQVAGQNACKQENHGHNRKQHQRAVAESDQAERAVTQLVVGMRAAFSNRRWAAVLDPPMASAGETPCGVLLLGAALAEVCLHGRQKVPSTCSYPQESRTSKKQRRPRYSRSYFDLGQPFDAASRSSKRWAMSSRPRSISWP